MSWPTFTPFIESLFLPRRWRKMQMLNFRPISGRSKALMTVSRALGQVTAQSLCWDTCGTRCWLLLTRELHLFCIAFSITWQHNIRAEDTRGYSLKHDQKKGIQLTELWSRLLRSRMTLLLLAAVDNPIIPYPTSYHSTNCCLAQSPSHTLKYDQLLAPALVQLEVLRFESFLFTYLPIWI